MTLTTIEKAAKLMGRRYSVEKKSTYVYDKELDEYVYTPFNPYTKKADLVDVECATIKYGMLRVGEFTDARVAHEAYLKAKREIHEFCTI